MPELPEWAQFDANEYEDQPAEPKDWDTGGIECECNDDIEEVAAHVLAYRYEIVRLREENERLDARDCNATIELIYDDGCNPFQREDCKVIDVGVADNEYVVEAPIVQRLQDDCKRLQNRAEAAEADVGRLESAMKEN